MGISMVKLEVVSFSGTLWEVVSLSLTVWEERRSRFLEHIINLKSKTFEP